MDELISDTELVRHMRNGDQAAFVALYRRHHSSIYQYAVLRCGSIATAADVMQEVFIGLMTDRFRYDALKGSLRFFLFGVARMVAMKLDSQNQKFLSAASSAINDDDDQVLDIPSEDATPLERLLNNQMAEDLRGAIACLAPHYRDVLILFEIQELSYLEIAEICNINVGTVRSRLSRARQTLAQRLSAYREDALRV